VLAELDNVTTPFDVICISGDTDCFLDADAGLELITGAVRRTPYADVMFTTRLVPEDAVIRTLCELAAEMATRHQLLLPGISLVCMRVPNFSERSKRMPSTEARIEFLTRLTAGGMACMLALRPTFPFALVGRDEVRTMIRLAKDSAAVILGEVMLLDAQGELAGRLGLDITNPDDRIGRLTFLDQPGSWQKRTLYDEVAYAAEVSHEYRVPYFLRSGQALEYIRRNWDWQQGAVSRHAGTNNFDLSATPDP
jgi:hypothetical protein